MKNELFTIGPLTVYGYGFMIATGVLAAWIVTEYRAKKQNLDSEHVFSLVLWCLMGGLLFAKASVLDHRMEKHCRRSGIFL